MFVCLNVEVNCAEEASCTKELHLYKLFEYQQSEQRIHLWINICLDLNFEFEQFCRVSRTKSSQLGTSEVSKL